MVPPAAAILAWEAQRAVRNWECAQQHPANYKPCVLKDGHQGLHKTEMSQRWDRRPRPDDTTQEADRG